MENYAKEIIIKESFNRELLQAEIEIHEQALAHLSEEIHDNIGQSLSLIKLNLTMKGEEPIREARQLTGRVINDLRKLAHSLHPDEITELGLQQAIKNDVARMNNIRRIKIHLSSQNIPPVFDSKTILLIYRIYQEAVNNIIKHAKARNIYISLQMFDQQLILDISDDGRGFDPENIKEGLGLKSIRKRAGMIGAELKLVSSPGNGSRLQLLIQTHLPQNDNNSNSHS